MLLKLETNMNWLTKCRFLNTVISRLNFLGFVPILWSQEENVEFSYYKDQNKHHFRFWILQCMMGQHWTSLDDLWAVKLSCLQSCLLDQGKWSDLKLMEAWLRSWNITLNGLEVSLEANHLIFCTWISPFVQDRYYIPALSLPSKNTWETCKISFYF